jgi:hypothetical protein
MDNVSFTYQTLAVMMKIVCGIDNGTLIIASWDTTNANSFDYITGRQLGWPLLREYIESVPLVFKRALHFVHHRFNPANMWCI